MDDTQLSFAEVGQTEAVIDHSGSHTLIVGMNSHYHNLASSGGPPKYCLALENRVVLGARDQHIDRTLWQADQ